LRRDVPSEFVSDIALHFSPLKPDEPLKEVRKHKGASPATENVGLGLDERFPQQGIQKMWRIEMRTQQILEHGVVTGGPIALNGMLPNQKPLAHITSQARL
jgi:hypothetical protein